MHAPKRWTPWPLYALVAVGCPADDGGDEGAVGSSGAPTSTTGDGTASATSTTGGPGDPEAFCAMRATPEACDYFDEEAGVFCAWWPVTPVTLTNGTCELGEPIGACLAMTGGTTAAGCGPPPGCDAEPWFREVDGVVRVSMQCGGSAPLGYEPCTYVEPGVFEPFECGCLCDEPIGTGTGTGTGTGA